MSTHYQHCLHELFKITRILVAVETGCCEGVSTKYLLAEMDKRREGELHSVEAFLDKPFNHPRLHFWHGLSKDVLPLIPQPWDLFLHDSDHEKECQEFEYEFAWNAVRPGGIIASDDTTWGTHRAWANFLAKHGLKEYGLEYARYTIKP